MGAVHEATQLSLGRRVALKLIAPEHGAEPAFRARFEREARIQAGLDHPRIVTVHEAGDSEHGLFIAMRLVRGRTLRDELAAHPLPLDRVVPLLAPVTDALDAAHAAGLVHRDIKPENVLLTDDGRARRPAGRPARAGRRSSAASRRPRRSLSDPLTGVLVEQVWVR
jgi:serine/threonine protein kinase